jgi:signal peptidase I
MTAIWKGRLAWFWQEWLRPLLVVGIVLGSLRSAVADWNDVPSGSMKPTILEGDRIFVNKVAYDLKFPFTTWRLAEWADPQRGDIVVLWSPYDGQRLVKRVVGVPGDTIEVRAQRLRVNGHTASYGPLSDEEMARLENEGLPRSALRSETVESRSHAVMSEGMGGSGSSFGPVTVPHGRYFLMGDHRDDSFDSRFWGFADRERILGRASAVVLSLDRHHYLRPRWHRFFCPLG